MSVKDRIRLFYSYAREDEGLREALDKHLSGLFNNGLIERWYDGDISAGTEWTKLIDEHLNDAQIILLLLSSDFIASDFCYKTQMKRAIERHDAGEARVIPIILRQVYLEETPISKLKALPMNGMPVTLWTDRDSAFEDITRHIRHIVNELQRKTDIHQENNVRGEQIINKDEEDGNIHRERTFQQVKKFRSFQRKVKELKSIHSMFHKIGKQLDGLSTTLNVVTRTKKETKKGPRERFFKQNDIELSLLDLDLIEHAWRLVAQEIDELKYFVSEQIKISDEHPYIESVTELFDLERSVENCIRNPNIKVIEESFNNLFETCKSHLSSTNTRLSDAIDELRDASEILLKDRS